MSAAASARQTRATTIAATVQMRRILRTRQCRPASAAVVSRSLSLARAPQLRGKWTVRLMSIWAESGFSLCMRWNPAPRSSSVAPMRPGCRHQEAAASSSAAGSVERTGTGSRNCARLSRRTDCLVVYRRACGLASRVFSGCFRPALPAIERVSRPPVSLDVFAANAASRPFSTASGRLGGACARR